MRTIMAIALLSLVAADDPTYFLKRYHMYLANNQSYLVIDLMGFSNASKFWGELGSVEFQWANESSGNSSV